MPTKERDPNVFVSDRGTVYRVGDGMFGLGAAIKEARGKSLREVVRKHKQRLRKKYKGVKVR